MTHQDPRITLLKQNKAQAIPTPSRHCARLKSLSKASGLYAIVQSLLNMYVILATIGKCPLEIRIISLGMFTLAPGRIACVIHAVGFRN